eukprot:TRINITY_DN15453_c0_g1_i2.p1 TRINITY_DN15453_c0_g1~~TRINITY_DN15453_c0_g1_i2.p1  ORF type:complete len:479 (+),score=95.91 TRINITY_DN15453_c0_g1_i2:62-1438(+)
MLSQLREEGAASHGSPLRSQDFPDSPASVRRSPLCNRIPRDGPCDGGGEMTMTNRDWLQSALFDAGVVSEDEDVAESTRCSSPVLSPKAARKWTKPSASLQSKLGGSRSSPDLRATAPPGRGKWGCSQAEVRRKHERLEAQRREDQQRIAAKVERRKDMRDSRSQRLLAATTGSWGVDYETSVQLNHWLGREDQRRRELHQEREKEVFQPIDNRIFTLMHWEQDRNEQQASTGQKKVAFPDTAARAAGRDVTPWKLEERDPVHRPQLQHAEEEAFHREAEAIIQGRSWMFAPGMGQEQCGHAMPAKAMSKPVLEPSEWEPIRLQGTLCGNSERLFDNPARGTWSPGDPIGMGATVLKRGGAGKFLPDEADGIPTAGKRTVRAGPRSMAHHDTGLLTVHDSFGGSRVPAVLGEAARFRTSVGASSAAPMQDHYTYERGADITDLEFPLGKRIFTGFPYH